MSFITRSLSNKTPDTKNMAEHYRCDFFFIRPNSRLSNSQIYSTIKLDRLKFVIFRSWFFLMKEVYSWVPNKNYHSRTCSHLLVAAKVMLWPFMIWGIYCMTSAKMKEIIYQVLRKYPDVNGKTTYLPDRANVSRESW